MEQPILYGKSAANIPELAAGIAEVPDASIFFHTNRILQKKVRYMPEPPNDFASWVTERLGYERLGEELASIDIAAVPSVEQLRQAFLSILEEFMRRNPRTDGCIPGHEFHFLGCQTFVMRTRYVASTLQEFASCVRKLEPGSLRYHVLDRALRGGQGRNDFSAWLDEIGEHPLAEDLAVIDPYTQNVDALRERIVRLVDRHLAREAR